MIFSESKGTRQEPSQTSPPSDITVGSPFDRVPTLQAKGFCRDAASLAGEADMDYLPKVDEQAMLKAIGVSSVDELFDDLPDSVRSGIEGVPPGASELEVERELRELLGTNRTAGSSPFFLGGGLYRHHIPAAVGAILSRSEFYTAYTPYQPEASQGTLQAGFEFASAMVELTGMEAAAQPLYDGATAIAEALRLAHASVRGSDSVIIPANLCRFKKGVLANYLAGLDLKQVELGWDPGTGTTDLEELETKVTPQTAGVYVELPNRFGIVDPRLMELKERLGRTLLIVGANPLALALYKPPGDWGADIVVGDIQPFGNAMALGGPTAGFITSSRKLTRKLPGRLVGLTTDNHQRRAFCLTLQTREQHIRRSKATSNICTNQGLNSLAAIVHLALLGRHGLRELAVECAQKARQTARRLASIEGLESPLFPGHFFNEFAVGLPLPAITAIEKLTRLGVNPGLPLDEEGLDHGLLVAVTERTTDEDIEALARAMETLVQDQGQGQDQDQDQTEGGP